MVLKKLALVAQMSHLWYLETVKLGRFFFSATLRPGPAKVSQELETLMYHWIDASKKLILALCI